MHSVLSYCDFQKPFNLSADVTEGYTVREHTERVLAYANLHKEEVEARLKDSPLTFDSFFTFLSLHDVGKGVGHSIAPKNPLAFKTAELQTTRNLIETHTEALGITIDDKQIYKALLSHDAIGDYLKGDIPLDGALDLIFKGAMTADMSPLEFFNLMDLFHAVDAGSYPTLQHLFRKDSLARVDEFPMETLRGKVLEVDEGEVAFYSHIVTPAINTFLQFERLRLVQTAGDPKLKPHFKRIKQGFKLISSSSDKTLLNEMIHFRRDYLSRYKIAKLGSLDCYDPDGIHQITWIHGTNGGIFANLEETGFSLFPTGILRKHKILLLSGELIWGARGINATSLSGCALDNISLSVNQYAKCKEFVDCEAINRKDFLSGLRVCRELSSAPGLFEPSLVIEWPDLLEKTIPRLLSRDPAFISPYLPELRGLIEHLQKSFNDFTQTKRYRTIMPAKRNPEWLHPDDYYYFKYKGFTESLDALSQMVNGSFVPACRKIDERLKEVGLVFASTKLVPRCLHPADCIYMHGHSEKVIDHPLPLEEITHVFATGLLDEVSEALDRRVKVLPMERLEAWIPKEQKLGAIARKAYSKE